MADPELSTPGLNAATLYRSTCFGQRETSQKPKVDLTKARMSAVLASVSFCSNHDRILSWNCSRCAVIPGFMPHKVIVDMTWDLLAYVGYLPGWHAVVVVFRGTDRHDLWNWVEDVRAWLVEVNYPVSEDGTPRVHSGFQVLWNSSNIGPLVTEAVGWLRQQYPSAGLHITGHSMGGALAHLAALDLKFRYGIQEISVYTFGSPRVGDWRFANLFQQHVAISWRFTHNRDLVPSMPPRWLGFHHVGREVWLLDMPGCLSDRAQPLMVVCDGSGEDPLCHNGACLWGMCTSLSDHLSYLDVSMSRNEEEC